MGRTKWAARTSKTTLNDVVVGGGGGGGAGGVGHCSRLTFVGRIHKYQRENSVANERTTGTRRKVEESDDADGIRTYNEQSLFGNDYANRNVDGRPIEIEMKRTTSLNGHR